MVVCEGDARRALGLLRLGIVVCRKAVIGLRAWWEIVRRVLLPVLILIRVRRRDRGLCRGGGGGQRLLKLWLRMRL